MASPATHTPRWSVIGRSAPGAVKATFGTGTSVMAPVDALRRPFPELSSTIAWSSAVHPATTVTYAIEGNIYATGAALEWTATCSASDGDVGALDAMARRATRSGGVCFVPPCRGSARRTGNPAPGA